MLRGFQHASQATLGGRILVVEKGASLTVSSTATTPDSFLISLDAGGIVPLSTRNIVKLYDLTVAHAPPPVLIVIGSDDRLLDGNTLTRVMASNEAVTVLDIEPIHGPTQTFLKERLLFAS